MNEELKLNIDDDDVINEESKIPRDDNDREVESIQDELMEGEDMMSTREGCMNENDALKLRFAEVEEEMKKVQKLNEELMGEIDALKKAKEANDVLCIEKCELKEEKEVPVEDKDLDEENNEGIDSEANIELKNEIDKLKNKIDEILIEKDRLLVEKEQLMLNKEDLMRGKEDLEVANSELISNNDALRIENVRKEAEVQEAIENNEKSDREIEKFSIMTNDIITEIEELNSDLGGHQDNIPLLNSLKKTLLTICEKVEVESEIIAKKFEKLEMDEKMTQDRIESLRYLENDLKSMVEDRNSLLVRYNLLEQEANNVKGEVGNLREVNAALVEEVKEMKMKNSELESFSKSRDLLQEEILAMKHEFQNVKDKLEDEQVALQEKCEQCEKLKLNLHDLEAEKEGIEVELNKMKEVLEEKEAQISEILASNKRDVSCDLKSELDECKEQLSTLQTCLEDYKCRINEYEEEIVRVKTQCNKRVQVLEEEFKIKMDNKVEEMNKLRNDEKEKLLESLEDCFEKERSEMCIEKELVEKRLAEERGKVEELMEVNKQLVDEVDVKEKRCDDLYKEFDDEKEKNKNCCERLENEIERLKEENDQFNSEIKKLEDLHNAEMEKIKKDYETTNQIQALDIDRLKLATKDAEIIIQKLIGEKEILEKNQNDHVILLGLELKEEKNKNENLNNDVENLKKIIENLKENLEEEKRKIKSMDELHYELETAKKTLNEVQEQKEIIENEKIELEKNKTKLENDKTFLKNDKIKLENDISTLKEWRKGLYACLESITGSCIADLNIDELRNHINHHIRQQLSSQLSLIQDEVTSKNHMISDLMSKNNEEYTKNTQLKETINDLNSQVKTLNEQLTATQFEVSEQKLELEMLKKRGGDHQEVNDLKKTVEGQVAELTRVRESRKVVTAEFFKYKEKSEVQEMNIRQYKRQIREQEEAIKRLTKSSSMDRLKELEDEVERMRFKLQKSHQELERAQDSTMQLKTKIMDRDKKLLEQTEEIFSLQDKLLSKEPLYPPLPPPSSESAFYQVLGDDRRRLLEENHMMKKELNDIKIRINKRDKQLTNIKIELLNKEKQLHAYEKRHTPQASMTPLGENNNNIPHTSSRPPPINDQENEDTVVLFKSLNKK